MAARRHPSTVAALAADAAGMMVAADFAAWQARLLAKARALGEARAASLAQRASPSRWRSAALLWPLFGKD